MSNNKKVLVSYKYNKKDSRKILVDTSHHEHTIRKIQRDE